MPTGYASGAVSLVAATVTEVIADFGLRQLAFEAGASAGRRCPTDSDLRAAANVVADPPAEMFALVGCIEHRLAVRASSCYEALLTRSRGSAPCVRRLGSLISPSALSSFRTMAAYQRECRGAG